MLDKQILADVLLILHQDWILIINCKYCGFINIYNIRNIKYNIWILFFFISKISTALDEITIVQLVSRGQVSSIASSVTSQLRDRNKRTRHISVWVNGDNGRPIIEARQLITSASFNMRRTISEIILSGILHYGQISYYIDKFKLLLI